MRNAKRKCVLVSAARITNTRSKPAIAPHSRAASLRTATSTSCALPCLFLMRSGFTFASTIAIKLRPAASTLLLASFAEVDHVAVMRVGWARVHFLAADVGKDHLASVAGHSARSVPSRRRCDNSLCVRVVEREAHAEDDATLKALAALSRRAHRVVVPAAVEQEGRDRSTSRPSRRLSAFEAALNDVDDAHHHRRHAGPLHALARREDLAAVRADPAQPARARVALRDRVGRDQAEGPAIAQQVEGAPEEVRNEVGVAVALCVELPSASPR